MHKRLERCNILHCHAFASVSDPLADPLAVFGFNMRLWAAMLPEAKVAGSQNVSGRFRAHSLLNPFVPRVQK